MKTIIVNENEKAFRFKNGKFVKLLNAGKYRYSSSEEIETVSISEPIGSQKIALDSLLENEDVRKQTVVAEVGDTEYFMHFVNGKFAELLTPGKYAFWNTAEKHTFQSINTQNPIVDSTVPEYIFGIINPWFYEKVTVAEYEKATLYLDGKFTKVLDAGTYYFWNTNTKVEAKKTDTRLTCMNITGQEILTQDKVSLRINVVCNYRITDCVKVITEVDDYKEQLHIKMQLAIRDFVGKHKLDEILESKKELAEFVTEQIKASEKNLYISVESADVKDIILPGEIRDIMNTVLVAEKKAQANVITRREEVASTRSLLNTAKLMDENETLYKLKELEYIERICENVSEINLNSCGGDILSQLMGVIRK